MEGVALLLEEEKRVSLKVYGLMFMVYGICKING